MRILLDTHVLLWSMTDDARIPEHIRTVIGNAGNDIFFSLASVWEVAIKHTSKPEVMPISEEFFMNCCLQSGFTLLPIEAKHIIAIKSLHRENNAPSHKDPFDKLLISQAKTESMTFITHDKLLPYYNESCIFSF